MAVDDIFQVTMNWDVDGAPMANVAHWVQTADAGNLTDNELADLVCEKVSDDVVANYLTISPNTLDWNGCTSFIVNKPTIEGSFLINSPGTLAQDMLPLRSAVVVQKKTGLRGRSYRGRFFLPPPGEPNQDKGVIIAAYLTSVSTFMLGLGQVGDGGGNVFKLAVYSPTLSDPLTSTFVANVVSSTSVNSVLGGQRGRQKSVP